MLILGGLAAAEVILARRLHEGYLDFRARLLSGEHGLPQIDRASAVLEDFVGVGSGIRYRWDPEGGVLRFGRRFGVIRGERGYAVGTIDFSGGDPVVRWHPVLLSLSPSVTLVATAVIVGVAVIEGPWQVLVALPIVWALSAFLHLILWANGQRTLERALLPRLAEAIEEHVRDHEG